MRDVTEVGPSRIGPPTGRWVSLVVLAGAGAALGTIWLTLHLDGVTLSAGLLLMLLEVVVVAAFTRVAWAILVAVSAVLLANWFLVLPTRTLIVGSTEDVILLIVFVIAAVLSSLTVSVALRRTALANRALSEAAGLRRTLAQAAGEADPAAVLATLCRRFEADGAELADDHGTVLSRWRRGPTDGPPRVSLVLTGGFQLRGWGPPVVGQDSRALHELGLAVLRSHEARELSIEAARAGELAEADRARSALLAAVGHDLRTPLAAISLSASTLTDNGDALAADDRALLVSTIATSARRLDGLIENLLDMSRLEAGKLLVHPTAVAVDEVVAEAVLSLPEGGVDIDIDEGLPLVMADSGLLQRVVANLISNGIRHGGGVRCTARVADGEMIISVIDHGPGIPDDQRAALFMPFVSTASPAAGLGLGLAIARGFCQAMGARLDADETPGGGLTMSVAIGLAT